MTSPIRPSGLIDHELDGDDHSLTFRSSDGKLFTIGEARALQSNVWKTKLGNEEGSIRKKRKASEVNGDEIQEDQKENEKDESDIIVLEEHSMNLLGFMNSLLQNRWERSRLAPWNVLQHLKLAQKYQAISAALYVPCMAEIKSTKEWTLTEVMLVYHYSNLFNLQTLKNLAARNFVRLGDIVNHGVELESIKIASPHLLDLFGFRKKWITQGFMDLPTNDLCTQDTCETTWNKVVLPYLSVGRIVPIESNSNESKVFSGLCVTHLAIYKKDYLDISQRLDSFTPYN